jgi:hypothetical protein
MQKAWGGGRAHAKGHASAATARRNLLASQEFFQKLEVPFRGLHVLFGFH